MQREEKDLLAVFARGQGASSATPVSPGLTRGRLLRAGVAVAAAAGSGAAAAGLAGARSRAGLTAEDRNVLRFALDLESLQVAFYDAALRSGRLSGEVSQYAHVVAQEEREHLAYVRRALGSSAHAPANFRFGDDLADSHRFVATAIELEQIGLGAYNGQTGNVSKPVLKAIARVISVEARHVAWARGLAGEIPAPHPTDAPLSAAAALSAVERFR